ncbi:tRNA (adenosine(37)-N6)-threonylcarbamoyltransferase complex ATPase subunit type 1 TsaE [Ignatzschineria indica]|nr:tRNA (adenosine(37)-N6)-threonylcarbamoyltransferase complex ATPase subunit type 1 TsaE [Ignatzschineria indica]MDM1545247.1 tRNA (adenosine(37)-N6)-threonylcarbamoyltransferase complex ATPase subunit type 1 TsaE [Ignatzschineria indica]
MDQKDEELLMVEDEEAVAAAVILNSTLNNRGELELQLPAEAATSAFAQQFATLLQREMRSLKWSDLKLYLHGNLGAGKTTFARYFIQAFGIKGAVKSPTYTLIEPYEITLPEEVIEKGRGKNEKHEKRDNGKRAGKGGTESISELMMIYHADLYRLASPLELYDLGLLEEQGIWLIEWPEKGEGVLPTADIELFLAREGEALTLRLLPQSEKGEALITQLHSQHQDSQHQEVQDFQDSQDS